MDGTFLCLMSSGLYVTEDLRDHLLREALSMIETKESTREVKSETYEGCVTTSFKPVLLGHFGGLQFDAKLEMGWRTFKMRYIVNPIEQPENAKWKWEDVHPNTSSHNPHMN